MTGLALLLWLACGGDELQQGVVFFDAGDYQGAVEQWSGLPDASWRVRYDLGLAAWEEGDVPRAVGLFRGAAQDRPRNADVTHNLALARGNLSGVPEPAPDALEWLGVFTPSEVGWLGVFLLLVFSAGAVRRRGRRGGYHYAGAAGLLCVALSLRGQVALLRAPLGVALVDGSVRDGPLVEGMEVGRLVAGTEVVVEGHCNGFFRVRSTRPTRGWVPAESVLVVTPGFGNLGRGVKTSLEVPCGLGDQPSR